MQEIYFPLMEFIREGTKKNLLIRAILKMSGLKIVLFFVSCLLLREEDQFACRLVKFQ